MTRLGADVAIDYRQQRFEDVAKDCDVVLDTQGGETLLRSFSCVRPGGVVVSVGGVPDAKFARSWGLHPLLVLALRLMTRKVTAAAKKREARFEYLFMRADGEQLAQITALVEQGVIKPALDRFGDLLARRGSRVRELLGSARSGRPDIPSSIASSSLTKPWRRGSTSRSAMSSGRSLSVTERSELDAAIREPIDEPWQFRTRGLNGDVPLFDSVRGTERVGA